MAQAERRGLPRVESRKKLAEQLERMNTPSRQPAAAGGSRRPRRKKSDRLKTYILETGSLVQDSRGSEVSWEIDDGGHAEIKILRIRRNDCPDDAYEFYLDRKDGRFLVLHTNENGTQANNMVRRIVSEPDYAFDHAWFYTGMLRKWAKEKGGRDGTYMIDHNGGFQGNPVKIRIDGTGTREIYDRLLGAVGERASQKAIEIQSAGMHGLGHVREHITNAGCFTVEQESSIGDHLHVVEECKDEYRGVISRVEENRLRTGGSGGSGELKGKPLVLKFPKRIPDLERFIGWVFNSGEPFRLWGTKWEISEGYYSVVGVDMHEGSPVNFEVADDMMRVYLYKGGCGNTLARILTNLELGYGDGITCRELEP